MVDRQQDLYDIIGDAEADSQHRELFRKFDEFTKALEENASKRDLLQMLKYLDEYTNNHFATEEKLFTRYGYPARDEHLEEHRYFICELWAIKSKLNEGDSTVDEALRSTGRHLLRWLTNHVSVTDVAAGTYIKEHHEVTH